MFADEFKLKIGDTVVKGRRLSIKELRANWDAFATGKLDIESSIKLIREHVRLEDGTAFDPEEISIDQLRKLIAEMTLPAEGRGISDFIGLLC